MQTAPAKMNIPHSRQTFGLKNAAKAAPQERARAASARKSGLDVHPAILAGGFAFIVAVGAVLLTGGTPQPQVQAGTPRIQEVSGGSQPAQKPQAQKPPQQQPASGGKFGAANDALGSMNR
jgi:hypothetical protein